MTKLSTGRLLVLLGMAVCTACAPLRTSPPAVEDLTSRVEAYWKLRQAKDLAGMYAFYSVGYRFRHPRAEFVKKTRLVRFDIVEFRVVRTEATGDRAEATVAYRTTAPPRVVEPFETELTEPWVRDPDGRWYKEKEVLLLPVAGPDGKPQFVED